MLRKTTATFIGHRECYEINAQDVQAEIIKFVSIGITDFLNGGMGNFDWICARTVYDLKKYYPQIRNHLVIPYLTFTIPEKKCFDTIIYPEILEKCHFKAAIPERNRYLIDHSSHALCYIAHDWGGAAKTFSMAIENGLNIINLGKK